ncbi:MAG: hydrophobic protein [Acidimicrobiales bacterium]
MGLILAVLLLVLIFGALGFAVHLLWIIAVIALLIWLIGFFVSGAERRWYHW